MNLIEDAWIPVRYGDGRIRTIAPWQLTEPWQKVGQEGGPGGGLPLEMASPRPDFDGALVQFLIGLLQTANTPRNGRHWRQAFKTPPTPEALRDLFSPFTSTFNLDGEGPRFMQDLYLDGHFTDMPIGQLLIDMPGDKARKVHGDHFIKRGSCDRMCPICATTALWCMQTNAPAGGTGYRTGIRGGGPLTTLLLGDTLWETVWLNVLDGEVKDVPLEVPMDATVFPWLGPTRTSNLKEAGKETSPEDGHPWQMFWATARRIQLMFSTFEQAIDCDVCGVSTQRGVTSFRTRNYGVNYTGAWVHPLSPYGFDKEGMPYSMHPQPGGLSWRHWLGLVLPRSGEKPQNRREPAQVVTCWKRSRERGRQATGRLWGFGYDMDNMKARCWYEGIMPLSSVPEVDSEDWQREVERLVHSAEQVLRQLRKRINDATTSAANVSGIFWQSTETGFYLHLDQLGAGYDSAGGEEHAFDRQAWAISWHKVLSRIARWIFEEATQSARIQEADPAKIARAWNNLNRDLNAKSLRETLNLAPIKATGKGKRAKS
ncbi:MAG: type I-E CRISPR-associated protein Cse1/CasA [Magnetococcales bacterium]|nr:type I-E CRISPR-associated protein Cse1/CasA [Magnetococcales bacterium]